MSKLTPKFVKDVDQPGSYQDGRGLILRVSATLRKRWVYRYMLAKQRHDLALGTYPALSLRDARLEADKYRLDIARGLDPAAERAKAKAAKASITTTSNTFRSLAERYIRTHSASWSKKHHQQWQNSLAKHVYPVIGGFRIAEVDTDDVLDTLTPIWNKIPVTANRIRNRIELVLDAAKALKLRQGENPARWRGHLDKLLPKQSHTVAPFPSPTPLRTAELLAMLDSLGGAAARAVEFAILTATRNQEVSGAQWSEIDWEEKIWSIPAHRMKAGKGHRVPLTEQMLEVLRQQVGKHDKWVFLNSWRTGPIPGNAMARVLNQLQADDVVPHGFRSTFRTWAAEETDHQREVCEMALAHTLNNRVEAAYNRGDLLDKRRALMKDWGGFLAANAPQVRGMVSDLASELASDAGSGLADVQPAA
ncbi:tyrosine-type recombinase/integrase [Pseudomonas aeruginosa]|uniref:tyrosine-type recombinase/integrase n=1 Tax=Pseudomonas aeruginosa TaxID=287 RepID=UPI003D29481C|nr:integrase arm-type DNA-binding domain-containing protein [Pseudomonas aeruginosa]